jgi:hypothetical protein
MGIAMETVRDVRTGNANVIDVRCTNANANANANTNANVNVNESVTRCGQREVKDPEMLNDDARSSHSSSSATVLLECDRRWIVLERS